MRPVSSPAGAPLVLQLDCFSFVDEIFFNQRGPVSDANRSLENVIVVLFFKYFNYLVRNVPDENKVTSSRRHRMLRLESIYVKKNRIKCSAGFVSGSIHPKGGNLIPHSQKQSNWNGERDSSRLQSLSVLTP